jgi:hypothetical protein
VTVSSPFTSPVPIARPRAGARRRNSAHSLPRLSVSRDEAAGTLGVSRDYFDEHVIGDLRIVRRGRRIWWRS